MRQRVVVVEALVQEDVGLDGVQIPEEGLLRTCHLFFPSALTPLAPQHASNRAETEAAGASTAIDRGSAPLRVIISGARASMASQTLRASGSSRQRCCEDRT